jgi:hypothetical protein
MLWNLWKRRLPPVPLNRQFETSLICFLFSVLGILGAATAHADSIFEKNLNPFKGVKWNRIGNLPQSPNFVLGAPFMHFSAVDLFQDAGTSVFSVHDGEVSMPRMSSSASPWVMTLQVLGEKGELSYYMHLDPHSIPSHFLAHHDPAQKVIVKKGDYLGKLIHSNGVLMPHLHFGMADCRRRKRLNPMKFLDIVDRIPPTINEVVAEKKGVKVVGPLSGKIDFTAEIYDQIDGSAEFYPPNKIDFSFTALGSDQNELRTISSNRFFEGTLFDATEFPFMDRSLEHPNGEIYFNCEDFFEFDGYALDAQGVIFRKMNRRGTGFYYALTVDGFEKMERAHRSVHPYPGKWNTAECWSDGRRKFPNGDFRVEVRASDSHGNQAHYEKVFQIANAGCEV